MNVPWAVTGARARWWLDAPDGLGGVSMSLEGPQLHYARVEDGAASHVEADETLRKALDLARQLEALLEDTRSSVGAPPPAVEDARAHSTRMARAFAASLVDELAALVRPARHTGSS